MKKLILSLALALTYYISYGQNTTWPSTNSTDKVGIGTNSPMEQLHVIGNVRTDGSYPYFNLYNTSWIGHTYIQNGVDPIGNGAGNYLSFLNPAGKGFAFTEGSTNAMIINTSGYVGIGITNPIGKLEVNDGNGTNVIAYLGSSGTPNAKGLYFSRPSVNTNPVNIQGTLSGIGATDISLQAEGGNVGIGTSNPQGYKLAVNGNMIAEEVKVKLHANWPDYVFKPNYKLPTLLEIKKYIDQNQHLPEMPTAEEVEKNGVNLGEMVKLQTKKIEELTLYLMEQNKKIEDQQKEIEKLKHKN